MSFLRLGQTSGFHMLTAHGFIDRSPIYDHILEATCRIDSFDSSGARSSELRVPLSDFAAFPLGSTFGQLMGKVKYGNRRQRSKRTVHLSSQNEHWLAERLIEAHSDKAGGRFQISLPPAHTVFINGDERSADRPLGITHSEPLRFLSSGVSLLLDTIAAASITRGPSRDLFVDPKESGMDDDGTLVVTPHRQFQNLTATLQIALLLTDDSIGTYFGWAYRHILMQLANGQPGLPGMLPLQIPCEFTIESELVKAVRPDGAHEVVELSDRIVSDHRKPQFKELVVRVRQSDADDRLDALQALQNATEQEAQRVTTSTRIVHYPRPSSKTFRVASTRSMFSKLFPEFGRVKVRVDRQFSPHRTSIPAARPSLHFKHADVASIAPPSSTGTTPRMIAGGFPEQHAAAFQIPTLSTRFLTETFDGYLEPVIVEFAAMPALLRPFLEAGYYLYEKQATDLMPRIPLGATEALLFLLPATWGGFASRDAIGNPRFIAAFPLRFDHGVVWNIEIVRRHVREQFAIGLCAPLHFDDPMNFLTHVMKAVCDRYGKRRDEGPSGTWPRANYLDVRIDTVVHSAARWHAGNLAEVLLARSEALLAPSDVL